MRIRGDSIWPRITPSPSVGEVGACEDAADDIHALDDPAEHGEAEIVAGGAGMGVIGRMRADR